MPVYTFTWTPSNGYTKDSKPEVTNITFGSGYSQRVVRGINNIIEAWNLEFKNQSLETAQEIVQFLENRGGIEYFYFSTEGEGDIEPLVVYKVICEEWSEEYVAHFGKTIKATFKRVYEL